MHTHIRAYAHCDGRRLRPRTKISLISTEILDYVICTHECQGTDRLWSASQGNKKLNATSQESLMFQSTRAHANKSRVKPLNLSQSKLTHHACVCR
jgi:hypothetical protein